MINNSIRALNYDRHIAMIEFLESEKNLNPVISKVDLLRQQSTNQIADLCNTHLHDLYYVPIFKIFNTIRYIGDIGVFIRMMGMDVIQFIEVKNKLSKEELLQISWARLYNNTNHDISYNEKVVTIQFLCNMIKVCSPECNRYNLLINHASVLRISLLMGWLDGADKNDFKRCIIDFATRMVFPETTIISIEMDVASSTYGYFHTIDITIPKIAAMLPDIYLFMKITRYRNSYYAFLKSAKGGTLIRKFIQIQLHPYFKDIVEYYTIKQELEDVISSISNGNMSLNVISLDRDMMKYTVDTWHKIVISNLAKLSYKGNKELSLKTASENMEFYDNLIGMKNADEFLHRAGNQMVRHKNKLFL